MTAAKPKCALCGASKSDLWLVKGQLFCYPDCYTLVCEWCDAVAEERRLVKSESV